MKYLLILLVFISCSTWATENSKNEYLLTNGDVIDINIYGAVRAQRTVIINTSGYITYLLTGSVKAAGKSISQLRSELHAIITKKRKHVIVSVIPKAFNSQSYTINGQIKFPGKKPLEGKTSLLQAIARSGGFQTGEFRNSTVDLANLTHAFVIRNNKQLKVDFQALILEGKTEHDILLENGDYINIPSALTQHIHILGQVNFPRKIMYLNRVTLMQAITEGRGLQADASNNAVIIRGSLTKPEKLVIDIKKILSGEEVDILLKPGDIVYVPVKGTAQAEALGKTAIRAFVRTVASSAADRTSNFLIPETRIETDTETENNGESK
jgi:polysaccharide biosynthesis/export protein